MATSLVTIDDTNFQDGNKAMASALLLYYQLTFEGCFCGDETVYIDTNLFDGFTYLDVIVEPSASADINQDLLREAAVVFVLCDLNDAISEYEDEFMSHGITIKVIAEYEAGRFKAIPEMALIYSLLKDAQESFNFKKYNETMQKIYQKYVLQTFKKLGNSPQP